jgi:hypothetical protein
MEDEITNITAGFAFLGFYSGDFNYTTLSGFHKPTFLFVVFSFPAVKIRQSVQNTYELCTVASVSAQSKHRMF